MKTLLILGFAILACSGCNTIRAGGVLETDYMYSNIRSTSSHQSQMFNRGAFHVETGSDSYEVRASGKARQPSRY